MTTVCIRLPAQAWQGLPSLQSLYRTRQHSQHRLPGASPLLIWHPASALLCGETHMIMQQRLWAGNKIERTVPVLRCQMRPRPSPQLQPALQRLLPLHPAPQHCLQALLQCSACISYAVGMPAPQYRANTLKEAQSVQMRHILNGLIPDKR